MVSLASHVFYDVFATSYKVDLTKATFLSYIVPPFVCQYAMGVLVQLEGTRLYRLALLPIALWLAWRAIFVDMSGGDPTQVQFNSMLITQMASISTRTAVFAFAHVQYRRYDTGDDRNKSTSARIWTACWNAWDLLLNPRGLGWNWPRGLVVPKPRYTPDTRVGFALVTTVRAVLNALAFDACIQIVRVMGAGTFATLQGGTLFDGTLPPGLTLLRAELVGVLMAAAAYFGVQYTHQALAVVCVVVFRQHPSQWPPLFDAPWWSASLGELWGRRWHQMMRDMVITLGGQPFGAVFGRLGGIVGAFLVSGWFHDVELRSGGGGGNTLVMVGFWGMNGVGIVLERVWARVTGRRVGGIWGRLWTAVWLLMLAVPMAETYAQAGRFGALCLIGRFEPTREAVEMVCGVVASWIKPIM